MVLGVAAALCAAIVVLLLVAVPALLRGLVGPKDGDAMARGAVTAKADDLRDSMGYWRDATDAESLAARSFSAEGPPVTVDPFAWEGFAGNGGVATIDVRIRAEIEARSATQIFGPSNTAGAAERCYRFTVPLHDYVTREDVACPSGPLPEPTATAEPELPQDAEARLRAVLEGADVSSLERVVEAAFPEDDIVADTASTEDGQLVAAVGIPFERECLVMVRHADGTIERVVFDRILLEPGEMGCSAELYTNPPL